MAENEDRELRKIQKEIEQDQKEIGKMLKELEQYADQFRDAARFLRSLDKAETWRLPDDYPAPRDILRKHFPRTANQCFFKGGWGYDAEQIGRAHV